MAWGRSRGPHVQTDDLVDVVAARREHEHRYVARGADTAQSLHARQAGHHDVQHDQGVTAAQRLVDARFAVVRHTHLEAFAGDVERQHRCEVDVIVNKQNLVHRRKYRADRAPYRQRATDFYPA